MGSIETVHIRVSVKKDMRIRLCYISRRKNVDYRDLLSDMVRDHLESKIIAIEKELKRKKVGPVKDLELRERIFKKAGGFCVYCGNKANGIDHIIPRTEEGCTNEESNLVAACGSCNAMAGNKVFSGFEEKKKYLVEQKRQWNSFIERCRNKLA